jgi:hypothetical protein
MSSVARDRSPAMRTPSKTSAIRTGEPERSERRAGARSMEPPGLQQVSLLSVLVHVDG